MSTDSPQLRRSRTKRLRHRANYKLRKLRARARLLRLRLLGGDK